MNKLIRSKDDNTGFPFQMADRAFISMPTQSSSEVTKTVFLKLCNHMYAISNPGIVRYRWEIQMDRVQLIEKEAVAEEIIHYQGESDL